MLAGTGYSVAEVLPVAVAVVYSIYQVPSNLLPGYVVDNFYKMRDERGKEMELTLQTKRLFDRELCESGVENRKIVDIQVGVFAASAPVPFSSVMCPLSTYIRTTLSLSSFFDNHCIVAPPP